ncbi:MAG TPA: DUF805 domain-containing protein [Caulobacter sp.]|nr:DUF805 domain-containing protein [Caulobacter sp.]
MNRATYWAMLGLIVALTAGGAALFHKPPKVTEIVLLFICIPRLHDVGRSGWWAGGVMLAEIAVAFAAPFVLGDVEAAAVAMGVVVLVLIGLLAWLGAMRGQAEVNRFGPPPSPGLWFKSKSNAI